MKSLIYRDGSLFTTNDKKLIELEDRDNVYLEYGIDEITQSHFHDFNEESLFLNVDESDSEKSKHNRAINLSGIKTIDIEEKY